MTREQQILRSILKQKGTVIPCFRCRAPLSPDVPTQKEHIHERALGGADIWENWGWSHKDCHRVVTSGSGATTAGSSIGKISKERRIVRTQKFAVIKPLHEAAFDVNLAAFDRALRKSAKVVHKAKRPNKYKRKVSGKTVLREDRHSAYDQLKKGWDW